MTSAQVDIIIIGTGPAGVAAALRAGSLGARTVLVARAAFGGVTIMDGPVPVRTLAHTARLLRDARQLGVLPDLDNADRTFYDKNQF